MHIFVRILYYVTHMSNVRIAIANHPNVILHVEERWDKVNSMQVRITYMS